MLLVYAITPFSLHMYLSLTMYYFNQTLHALQVDKFHDFRNGLQVRQTSRVKAWGGMRAQRLMQQRWTVFADTVIQASTKQLCDLHRVPMTQYRHTHLHTGRHAWRACSKRAHLLVLDHAQLEGIHPELSMQVCFDAPTHADADHQIGIPRWCPDLLGHLLAAPPRCPRMSCTLPRL